MRPKGCLSAFAVFALAWSSTAGAQEYPAGPGTDAGAYMQGPYVQEEMPGLTAGPDYIVRDRTQGAQPSAPGWLYTRLEAIALRRERQDRVFLGEQDNLTAGQVVDVFTTKDVNFDWEPGIRATVGVQLSDCKSIELSYFTLQDWKASGLFPNANLATNALFSPFLSIGSFADAFQFSYTSELHNVELNCQRQIGLPYDWGASILGGVRYINLNEHFTLSGSESVFGTLEATSAATHNNLIGVQLGGELVRSIGQKLSVGFQGRAGVYANIDSEHTSNAVAGATGTLTRLDAHDSDIGVSTTVEAGLAVRYHLRSNIVIGAGYQVFFLNGVALAPNQLTSTNFDIFSNTITPGRTGRPINDNNNILFHGPSVGIEITWGGGKREQM